MGTKMKGKPRITYAAIKVMAREMGVRVGDLIALTARYDPFYVGRASDLRKAKWAKQIWVWTLKNWETKRRDLLALGYHVGATPHLRGVHYLFFTGYPNPKLPNGKPYLGTAKNWESLLEAFVKAKILRLVPFGQMEDRKHPTIVHNLLRTEDTNIDDELSLTGDTVRREVSSDDVGAYLSPKHDDIHNMKIYETPEKSVTKRLPYHTEIWDEKSIRLIDQIAQRFYANVQHSTGEQTYEPVYGLLRRAKFRSKGRPVRIDYVSDYDPRGNFTIPVSVARKIEWYVNNLDEFKGMDVKLRKIALTEEQVKELKLPPAPVKSTEPMRKRWIEMCGEDVVELEALETLHPVEFVRIIENELRRYYDEGAVEQIEGYNKKVAEAIEEYNEGVEETVDEAYRKHEEKIKAKIKKMLRGFKTSIEVDLESELEELKEIIGDWEEPEWKVDEGDEWLYDSKRDYLSQLEHYKRARGDRKQSSEK